MKTSMQIVRTTSRLILSAVGSLAPLSIMALLTLSLAAQVPAQVPTPDVERRIDDLIGRMTLEEKVQQMRDHAPAIPRLGVPKYDWWNEGLHGVAFAGYATEFPQVIGMAATWDDLAPAKRRS